MPTKQPVSKPNASSNPMDSNYIIGAFIAALLLLLMGEVHALDKYRSLVIYAGTILLILLLGATANFVETVRTAFRYSSAPMVAGLVCWAGISYLWAEHHSFATAELLRVLAGGAAFLLIISLRRFPDQFAYLLLGLIGISAAFALFDFTHIGEAGGRIEGMRIGFFGTHEEMGTLAMLPLPLAAALTFHSRVDERWRIIASALTLFLGIALLITQCRSAWIGGAFGLGTIGVLSYWYNTSARQSQRVNASARRRMVLATTLTVVVTIVVITVFGVATGLFGAVASRAGKFGGVFSQSSRAGGIGFRLKSWDGGIRMLVERPLTGWGLGEYPPIQAQWTHQGDDFAEVIQYGIRHPNIAHDYYIQWASETGAIGLTLHIALLAGFFFACIRRLPTLEKNPMHQAILTGCVAAVAGACVDAIGSPSYNYPGLSTFFWAILGTGSALLLPIGEDSISRIVHPNSPQPMTSRNWQLTAAVGVLASAALFGIGLLLIAPGAKLPPGKLEIEAQLIKSPNNEKVVTWVVHYKDENGEAQPTAPGTLWQIETDDPIRDNKAKIFRMPQQKEGGPIDNAAFELHLNQLAKKIIVTATYRDAFNRIYHDDHILESSLPSSAPPVPAPKKP